MEAIPKQDLYWLRSLQLPPGRALAPGPGESSSDGANDENWGEETLQCKKQFPPQSLCPPPPCCIDQLEVPSGRSWSLSQSRQLSFGLWSGAGFWAICKQVDSIEAKCNIETVTHVTRSHGGKPIPSLVWFVLYFYFFLLILGYKKHSFENWREW